MGQKSNPIGNRLGIIKGWESMWLGRKEKWPERVEQDYKIRNYIMERFPNGRISRIIIERVENRGGESDETVIITIYTAAPGILIGRGGAEVRALREELNRLTGIKDIRINVGEVKRPELEAPLVAETIARQIEARVNHRRAVKAAMAETMRMGAEGIRVEVSGRLGGAEIARKEKYIEGRVPLSTLRADIDYALKEAFTVWGVIGVKVWICRGEVYGRPDLSEHDPERLLRRARKRTYLQPIKS